MTEISRRATFTGGVLATFGLLPLPGAHGEAAAAPASADVRRVSHGAGDASTRFGYDLLLRLAHEKGHGANLAVSPVSLMAAFSLVDLGADAAFRTALRKTLRLDAREDGGFAALRKSLAPLISGGQASGPVFAAEAVYVDQAIPLKADAVAALKSLGADIATRRLEDPAVPAEINAFVRDRTKGGIPTLIDGELGDKGLVLINALYFKDAWKTPFSDTRNADFHLAGDATRAVKLMYGSDDLYPCAEDGAFAAVQLPYESAGYSLIILVRNGQPARIEEFAPAAGWLAGSGLTLQSARVTLPRFSIKSGGAILSSLDEMGLKPARLRPGTLAGFSDAPMTIAAVPHKVAITVDEGGTTAAAATAVEAMPTSARPPPPKLVEVLADRPFMFALCHDGSGQTLMIGYVGNPGAA